MGQRLALVVGVSEYGEGFEPLPGSLQDVQAMAAALQDPDCGAFEVQPLENCDRAILETQIEQFFGDRDKEDLLLFYFSGHGDLGSGGMLHQQLHFCTRNTQKAQGRVVESSALSAGFLKRQMDLSRAQQIAVILDCCYSGAIADLLKKGEGDIDFGELKAQGRVILASSSAVQVALQAVDGLSLYTRYLVEGMNGAAYPGQGSWIMAQDLHAYADRRFEIESKGGYSPKIIAEDTGFNLPIVRAPKPDPKLTYRQTVDRIYQELDQREGLNFNGEISNRALILKRLQIAQRKLGITPDEATQIEIEVQLPYQSRAQKRQDYAEAFELATQEGHLPNEYDRQLLDEICQDLALGEEDVIRIEELLTQKLHLQAAPIVPVEAVEKLEPVEGVEEPSDEAVEILEELPQEQAVQNSPYAQLESYLSTQQWREADYETYRLMITIVGKKEGDWFNCTDLENFPCEDLRTLDQLWVRYSNGKWGFSVQKRIWQECGSPMNYNDDWEKFGDCIGWYNDGWLEYGDFTFDLENSRQGKLPVLGWKSSEGEDFTFDLENSILEAEKWRVGVIGGCVLGISFLAQRLVKCSNPSPYAQLEEYLSTQQWRKADQETYRLMITIVGKEKGQGLNQADLENFPCEDLRTLDQLWIHYSSGKWGYSVQKRIWQECGSPMDYNDDWEKFGVRVGWRKDGDWVDYDNLTFSLENSLEGEFPKTRGWGEGWWGFSSLAQRLVNCSTSQS